MECRSSVWFILRLQLQELVDKTKLVHNKKLKSTFQDKQLGSVQLGRVDLGSGLKKLRPSGNCEL